MYLYDRFQLLPLTQLDAPAAPVSLPTQAVTPAPPQVRDVRVVVKSFIRCIRTNIGTLPLQCRLSPVSVAHQVIVPGIMASPVPSQAALQALAMVTDRLMCEEPVHDRKDKGYRLYSACTFRVSCQGGRAVDIKPSALDTDSGKEGPLQAPRLIANPVQVVRSGDGFDFSWWVRGRPPSEAEGAFQVVCPRTSVFIWHRIYGRVRCTPAGTDVIVNLTGSRFPTHRVFVNGRSMQTVPQEGFARLWFPASPTYSEAVE